MSKENRGEPAFPFEYISGGSVEVHPGMTLRDYFAAKAMQAAHTKGIPADVSLRVVAETCYEVADAMLAARAK